MDSQATYLEGNSVGSYQNYTKYAQDWSLSSYDVPHRLVTSYVLDLPFGKGKKFAAGLNGAAGKLISGWSAQGIVTLQSGYPLALKAQANNLSSFGVGIIRPNYVTGCVKEFGGRAQDRLAQWFNTACFIQPTDSWTLGTESRTDAQLRTHGVNNWDFTLSKNTTIREGLALQFKAEFFNVFNRVQFQVNTTTVGSTSYGIVTSQLNKPRLVQFALRLAF